jgi:hypothetical protein
MTLARLILLLVISGALFAADKPAAQKTSDKGDEEGVVPPKEGPGQSLGQTGSRRHQSK